MLICEDVPTPEQFKERHAAADLAFPLTNLKIAQGGSNNNLIIAGRGKPFDFAAEFTKAARTAYEPLQNLCFGDGAMLAAKISEVTASPHAGLGAAPDPPWPAMDMPPPIVTPVRVRLGRCKSMRPAPPYRFRRRLNRPKRASVG